MRWRLYILFLSITAVFCFMLLTAVTDYGAGGRYQAPMVSAFRETTTIKQDLQALLSSAPLFHSDSSVESRRETSPDPLLKPIRPALFVPRNADPVLARHLADEEERVNRPKHTHRSRLKWDENGWHREELALTTAYCPCPKCCGTQSPGITSIGKNAWTNGLAADPTYLNYGTKVFVPGYGLSVIDDTGGAMRRHWRRNGILHIDVRMTYHYEARQWGKQYLRVKIYEDE